jgi:hypothetical protein
MLMLQNGQNCIEKSHSQEKIVVLDDFVYLNLSLENAESTLENAETFYC